ncbi:hypothetical protein D3C81_435230 [compost metagenome]
MDHQQSVLDLVRIVEWRHGLVDAGRLPERTLFRLEAERRQGAVIRAAAGDAGAEQTRMRQQVARHEGAIRVAADGDAVAVGHPTAHHLVDGSLGIGHQLRQIRVIRFLLAVADDGERWIVEHGVAHGQEGGRAPVADGIEFIRRTLGLAGRAGRLEFLRVGPHQGRQGAIAAGVVVWRQHQGGRQVHAVGALVADQLFLHVLQLRQRVREMREGRQLRGALLLQVAHIVVRLLGRRFARGQQAAAVLVQHGDHVFIVGRGALEQPLLLFRRQVQPVDEGTVAFLRSALAVKQDGIIKGDEQARQAGSIRAHDGLARVVVAVFERSRIHEVGRCGGLIWRNSPLLDGARLVPRFTEQCQVAAAPGYARIARTEPGQHGRLAGERRCLRIDDVADLGYFGRVAAILRFGPHQRRWRIDPPADGAHAGGHGIIARRQAFFQRHAGHRMQHFAAQVAHIDLVAEVGRRHDVGIWTQDARRQQMLAVRRGGHARELARLAHQALLARHVQQGQLHRDVVFEQLRILLVFQQVGIGAQLLDAATGHAVLDRRSRRDAACHGRCAQLGRLQLDQQGFAIGHPGKTTAIHGRQGRIAQLARRFRLHVEQPQFHACLLHARGGIGKGDVGERQVALVRRPSQVGDARRYRQAADLDFLLRIDVEQAQSRMETEAAGRIRARIDAQARQLQFRLRHFADAGQGWRRQHGSQVAFRTQAQGRRARRIDDGLQGRGWLLIAAILRHGQRRRRHQADSNGQQGETSRHGTPERWMENSDWRHRTAHGGTG